METDLCPLSKERWDNKTLPQLPSEKYSKKNRSPKRKRQRLRWNKPIYNTKQEDRTIYIIKLIILIG